MNIILFFSNFFYFNVIIKFINRLKLYHQQYLLFFSYHLILIIKNYFLHQKILMELLKLLIYKMIHLINNIK